MINSKSSLLKKRDFYTAIESQNEQFSLEAWEKIQAEKNDKFLKDIERQLDVSQYIEEYVKNAEIIEGQSQIKEFTCFICLRLAFEPVECQKCFIHLCSKCFDLHKQRNPFAFCLCPACQDSNQFSSDINQKIIKIKNNIEVSCKNINCIVYNKKLSLKEYLNPNHIAPCKKLEANCSLGCSIKIKSIQESKDHLKLCIYSIEKCQQGCEQNILKQMQGSHDCIHDLKEENFYLKEEVHDLKKEIQKNLKIIESLQKQEINQLPVINNQFIPGRNFFEK